MCANTAIGRTGRGEGQGCNKDHERDEKKVRRIQHQVGGGRGIAERISAAGEELEREDDSRYEHQQRECAAVATPAMNNC